MPHSIAHLMPVCKRLGCVDYEGFVRRGETGTVNILDTLQDTLAGKSSSATGGIATECWQIESSVRQSIAKTSMFLARLRNLRPLKRGLPRKKRKVNVRHAVTDTRDFP